MKQKQWKGWIRYFGSSLITRGHGTMPDVLDDDEKRRLERDCPDEMRRWERVIITRAPLRKQVRRHGK